MSSSVKGPSAPDKPFDGCDLRIAIVHARWNKQVIDALVAGALVKLKACGVKDSNIVVQSVPGSFELPLACAKVIAASRVQANATTADLLNLGVPSRSSTPAPSLSGTSTVVMNMPQQPFDAVIAIGTLIKGSTMHFEYICDSVTHALMKVQLDTGVPVIFGVLTAVTEEQALERAGLGTGENKGHNHGEDWGLAAVEMGTHCKRWARGNL